MNKSKNVYEDFANAVIMQAVKDWRDSARKLKRGRKNLNAEQMKAECEEFFKSPQFSIFTAVDGKMILAKLESEVIV